MPRLIDGDRLIDWLRIVPLENGMIDPDEVVDHIREMQIIRPDPPKEEEK
jgi:hypothetical protein